MATISKIAHFEGIGLHTGQNVQLHIHPAATNHGVVFVRTDIESRPKIPANINYIDYRQRRTALVNDGVEIQTPEHFLAACYGLGIDNLLVEISGPELPGADGSALPFCQVLMDAGIENQEEIKTIKIESELQVDRDKASIKAVPDTGFSIEYTLDHDLDFFPKQVYSLKITRESFIKEIAPARTFVLKKEVEALQKFGLGKGATVKNTLVIDDDGTIIDNELRFADEFTRHKILDIVGDFFLLGARLEGKLYAHRSGHNLNAMLVEKIQACQAQSKGQKMSNIEEILSSEELDERVQELAEEINDHYQDEEVTILTVLNGAFIFAADLARAVDLPLQCEFVKVSSYGDNKVSSGNVKMVLDIDPKKIEGQNVILVEDIVDTGNTIVFLKEYLQKMSPKTLKVCSLLLKKEALQHDLQVDFTGFSIPSLFVVGYGLDYAGLYRDLPFLGVLLEEGESLDKDALLLEKGQ